MNLERVTYKKWRDVRGDFLIITMKKIITLVILLFLLVLSVLFIVEKFRFPVKYVICSDTFDNCFTSAKFKDMRSCQYAAETGNWLCNKTDRENITCKPAHDSGARGLCSQ